ncbi:MAG: hypothetical protein NPINA01_06540 [Nitrospinaceae bacterium]|nr:MAG: hypothetical protein NPINA01_06540 [Nitrospinaceae bacterium]
MPNAFKIPSEDSFIHEDEVQKSEKIFKYKKSLLFLSLTLLIGAAFSLYFSSEDEIELSNKSLEQHLTPPDEHEKPLPVQNQADQQSYVSPIEKIPTAELQNPLTSPSPKKGDKEFSYRKDKEYLAMNRFERPRVKVKEPTVSRLEIQDSVAVVDKPLALAGRGFDIKGFQSYSRETPQADFLRHLKRPVPKPDPVLKDHLDLQLSQVKSSKHLIFHPLGPSLSPFQKPAHPEGPEPQKKPQALKPIPETKLLLNEGEKSGLLLRPGSESLDLLIGNEKINRKRYESW